jgi:hypothetical protein
MRNEVGGKIFLSANEIQAEVLVTRHLGSTMLFFAYDGALHANTVPCKPF